MINLVKRQTSHIRRLRAGSNRVYDPLETKSKDPINLQPNAERLTTYQVNEAEAWLTRECYL